MAYSMIFFAFLVEKKYPILFTHKNSQPYNTAYDAG